MGDDITIGVTEIVNNIEVTAQPNDQIIDIDVVDNSDDVTLNITPTVVEININRGSSFARWGTILGNLPDQADLQNVLNLKADLVGGLVPASQLPSYVDDIVEVANYAALPVVGETGKIYLTLDNNKIYRWSGSVYIEIASDSGYVHIAGAETITGLKTFTETAKFDLNINLSKTGLFNVPSLYNTIGAYNTEFKFGIDSSRIAIVDLANLTAPRIYNYPDKDGIFAMTSDLHSAVTIGTANGLSLSGQELSLGLSSASTNGALSSTDWSRFNSAVPAGTPTTGDFVYYNGSNLAYKALLASAPLSFNSGTGTFSISQANTSTNGYLSSTDWNTFNNKQGGLSGTGFVKISGTTISYDNSTYALDNVVVKLTGDQSISGIKTFSTQIKSNILLINESGGFSGATGYTQLGGTADYFQIVNGGGSKQTKFIHTGVRNITMPASDGTMALTSQIPTVSGTTNYIPKFTGSSTIGDSVIFDDGTQIGIGTNVPQRKLSVRDINNTYGATFSGSAGLNMVAIGTVSGATNGVPSIAAFTNSFGATTNLAINPTGGNVGIGTTSPSGQLDVIASTYQRFTVTYPSTYLTKLLVGGGSYIQQDAGGEELRIAQEYGSGKITFFTGATNTERMRITSSGNVGIGTTTVTNTLSVGMASSTIGKGISLTSSAGVEYARFGVVNSTVDNTSFIGSISNNNFAIYANNAERMRITSSGVVCIGTTSAFDSGLVCSDGGTSYVPYTAKIGTTASSTQMFFRNPNGVVGSISTSGTLTSFNVTSDYRLKQDFKEFNGLDLVSQIKVYDYEWKADNSRMNGVIAHELQEVVPYAVTGEKDAEQMQSVDYSKLVPILVQAIQELKAEIEILKNK